MTVTLGIDLGEARIGVAIAEGADTRARPLATLRRTPNVARDVDAILALVPREVPRCVVVGLPLDLSGSEGEQARRTREWVAAAAPRLGCPVQLRDERLTSHLAEQRLGPMPRGRSGGPPTPSQRRAYRARVDRVAAAIILQDELDAGIHDR